MEEKIVQLEASLQAEKDKLTNLTYQLKSSLAFYEDRHTTTSDSIERAQATARINTYKELLQWLGEDNG